MLRLSYFLGNYYPRGGSQAFADELARRFEELGGHVLMRSRVRRIIVEGGRAAGVEIERGAPGSVERRRVRANIVVSNADLLLTLERLLGPEHIDAKQLARLRELRPSLPCFLTYIGLREISDDSLRAVDGYHWSSWNAEDVATNAFKIFVPTLFDQSIAPPGGQIIIVQKLTDIDYEKISDWQAHKASVEENILANLERVLPGISQKTVLKLSASALTSHKYTLNHHGAMLGWEMSPDQLGAERPDIVGAIENLYFVGHWTQPGGGVTPVIVSAMRAAKMISQSALCLSWDEADKVMRAENRIGREQLLETVS